MKTLLVPVDGSKNSLRALKYAAAQSRHCPVTLHIVNVEPPLDDYGMVRAYISRRQYEMVAMARAGALQYPRGRRQHAGRDRRPGPPPEMRFDRDGHPRDDRVRQPGVGVGCEQGRASRQRPGHSGEVSSNGGAAASTGPSKARICTQCEPSQ